jgi:translation elongation factor EF-Tu-like GTPase
MNFPVFYDKEFTSLPYTHKGDAMDILIGKVTHYYNRLGVAVVELAGELRVGDQIAILGHTTEFTQPVESLEIEHHKIDSAGAGQEVALKAWEIARAGDLVYKIVA